MPDRHAIGCRFRARRIKKGLTLAVVCKRMKISESQLCKLENGQKQWKPAYVAAYEKALR